MTEIPPSQASQSPLRAKATAPRPPTSRTMWLCGILSFLIYAPAVFFGDAFSAGSSFQEGLGHAIVFGTFFIGVTFPLMIGLGFALRWAFERLFRRRLLWRSVLPWFAHLPLTVFMLTALMPVSPAALYRARVSSDVPVSLAEVHYWHTSGFGNSNHVLCFKVDPAEFDMVLTRHAYDRQVNTEGYRPLETYSKSRPDFPIAMPSEPLVEVYTYNDPSAGNGGGLWVSHYTTQHHDFVITIESFN